MNTNNLSYIITTALKSMGVNNPTLERVIKGTFLMESQLEDFYDVNSNLYGLMMMSEKRLKTIYTEYLRYNWRLTQQVKNATFINVVDLSFDDFKNVVNSNISMMVAVLYIFYLMEGEEFPDDSIEDIARYYVKCYVREINPTIESEFIEYYKETFNK